MAKITLTLINVCGLIVQGDLGPLTIYTNRRHSKVMYPQAPPLCPPSPDQTVMRRRMAVCAEQWRALTTQQRADWHLAAKLNNMCGHGYTLWTYGQLTGDQSVATHAAAKFRIKLAGQ